MKNELLEALQEAKKASKEFDIDIRATEVCARCKEFAGWLVVWELKTQKWADVITEPQKWKIYVEPFKHSRDDNKIIIYLKEGTLHKEQAQEIATKIKEILK